MEFSNPMSGLAARVHELRVRLLDEAGAELATVSCAFGVAEPPL